MARHSVLQNFYASDAWRNFRMALIAERGLRCQHCGNMVTHSKELTGHHETELTPDNVQDATIALNPKLVKLVHHHCHNEIHRRFGARRQRRVYLVYGPPFSGKMDFVREQMMRGDLVVDMDRLYEAVSMQPIYDKPDNLLSNVIGIHNLLLDQIKTRTGKWGDAWVVGGYADKYKRERIADDLGAELVYIQATREACIERLRGDPIRSRALEEWQGYIGKWFEQYQE